MLDRELKQVIARVSMATLIVIAIFVTLAVVLTARYDIGTQTAHANEGEQTPTPTPIPFWDTYTNIGCNTAGQDVTNEISSPTNNTSYYLGQTVTFSCSRATDYDRRWVGDDMTYPSDSMASSGWPQWTCGFGSWQSGDVGTSVTWIAPSSPQANISILVADNDLPASIPGGEEGTRDDSSRTVDSRTVNAVGIDKIQWNNQETWTDVPATMYVAIGDEVEFKAIKNPSGASWPSGKPVWSGSSGVSGTGETKSVTFDTTSTSDTDYKTVSANCGNTVTLNVIVVAVDKIEVQEGSSWVDRTGQTIYVDVGTTVSFRAQPAPTGASWPTGCPVWSGDASGTTGTQVTITFNTTGEKHVTAGSGAKTVTVVVIKVEIKKPQGSLDANPNPVASWLSAPCYHFDFQGVIAGSPGPYVLDIEGKIDPIPPASYKWTLDAAAGTLSNDTMTIPTHNAPANEGQGILKLKAMVETTDTGFKDERKLNIYKDHLARDRENFGTGISCWNNWSFTAFNTTITLTGTWNCHGSVHHSYDGSGNGNADNTVGWTTTEFTPPINWTAVASALSRGDVVSFYSGNPAGYTLQHSHTCLTGTTMYGANNEPSVNFDNSPPATWKWDECTSEQYFDAVNVASQAKWGINYLTRILVHDKP